MSCGQFLNATRGRMQTQLQFIKRKCAANRNHQFAVEDELLVWQLRCSSLPFDSRNTILEDDRVSAFRNFFINLSAELFSFFVFDTVQSEGTNKWNSRL